MIKTYVAVIVIIIILAGVYFFSKSGEVGLTPRGTSRNSNSEMIVNEDGQIKSRNLPIIKADVTYFSSGVDVKGYYVRPADSSQNKTYPAVVMIHENRGLRPEIRTVAEELAKEGYLVLAVDLLGGVVETQDEARMLTSKFNQQVGVENMRAAVSFLRNNGATKVASLGWCFGGKQSLELAISGEKLDATVVYYGGGMATTTQRLVPIKWPVLGIFGDKDQAIPVEMVLAFESSLNSLGVSNEIYIYPGVGHAFANPSGMNYAPEATMDAWKKTLTFLEKNLK